MDNNEKQTFTNSKFLKLEKNNKHIITLENLKIGYKNKVLADGINLSVTEGDMLAVMGRNGSGKSTLIKTIAGLLPALDGNIVINGKSPGKCDRTELALNLAVVLTEPVVTRDLTVFETVSYGRYPHTSWLGRLGKSDVEIINSSISDVGLDGFQQRVISSLSDGEMQRVMIAKGLAQQTPVMILDEPTAHLDLLNRLEIIELLKRLTVENGITVVFSTHEIDLVRKSADKVWLFKNKGEIVCGTAVELMENGDFTEVFGKGV